MNLKKPPGCEDVAEDLSDPAVQARQTEVVKNRHYPADTYRVQDGCANCGHVFVRKEYDWNDELYCAFRAPPRPPCMSVSMDELVRNPSGPFGADTDAHETWDAWKEGREVLPQGICGEWETQLERAESAKQIIPEATHMATDKVAFLCSDCGTEIRVGDEATICPGEDGKMGAAYCFSCSKARNFKFPDDSLH